GRDTAGTVLRYPWPEGEARPLVAQGGEVGRRAVRRRTGESERRGGQGSGTGQRDDRGLQGKDSETVEGREPAQATRPHPTSRNSHPRRLSFVSLSPPASDRMIPVAVGVTDRGTVSAGRRRADKK